MGFRGTKLAAGIIIGGWTVFTAGWISSAATACIAASATTATTTSSTASSTVSCCWGAACQFILCNVCLIHCLLTFINVVIAKTIVTLDILLYLLDSNRVGTHPAGANPGIVAGRQTKPCIHPARGLQYFGNLLEDGAVHCCVVHWVVNVGAVVGKYFRKPRVGRERHALE